MPLRLGAERDRPMFDDIAAAWLWTCRRLFALRDMFMRATHKPQGPTGDTKTHE